MTIHAPAHPGGVVPRAHDNVLGWFAATVAIVLLAIAVLAASGIVSDQPTSWSAQQRSLIEYRA